MRAVAFRARSGRKWVSACAAHTAPAAERELPPAGAANDGSCRTGNVAGVKPRMLLVLSTPCPNVITAAPAPELPSRLFRLASSVHIIRYTLPNTHVPTARTQNIHPTQP